MSTERSTVETEQLEVATTTTDETTDETAGASNESKKLTADEKKQEIVKSFQQRLDRGEVTIDQIAESQPWVAELLSKKEKKDPAVDKTALKEELKKELRLETAWDALYDLASPSQKKEIDEVRKSYESSLGSEEALKLAARLTGVDVSSEAKLRKSMRLREISGEVEDEEPVKVSSEHRRIAKIANADPKVIAERLKQLEQGGSLTL